MATVIIAIIVFGLVGLDIWYIVRNLVRHNGKLGCDGYCGGGCSECGGCSGNCAGGTDCAGCSAWHSNDKSRG